MTRSAPATFDWNNREIALLVIGSEHGRAPLSRNFPGRGMEAFERLGMITVQ